MTTVDRRTVIAGLGGGLLLAATAGEAATTGLAADDGSPIRTFAMPSRTPFVGVPGLQRFGAEDADVVVFEAFDYNCGYCRKAAPDLDAVLASDPRLALVLVHDPILSPASAAVAALQQTIYRRSGAEAAHGFHRALLDLHGFVDAPRARAIALAAGHDPATVEASREAARAAADLEAQKKRAADLRLKVTPSFVVGETAFIGWPGAATLRAMVAAERACGRLRCD